MLALALEFTVVVAWFLWMHRRQLRARQRARRPPPDQLRLPLEPVSGSDREVGS